MEETSDAVSRLIQLIDDVLKLGRNEFAREIGEKPPTLSRHLNRKNNASADIYPKIKQRYPIVNMNWLVGGKGEPLERPRHVDNTVVMDFEASRLLKEKEEEIIKLKAKLYDAGGKLKPWVLPAGVIRGKRGFRNTPLPTAAA